MYVLVLFTKPTVGFCTLRAQFPPLKCAELDNMYYCEFCFHNLDFQDLRSAFQQWPGTLRLFCTVGCSHRLHTLVASLVTLDCEIRFLRIVLLIILRASRWQPNVDHSSFQCHQTTLQGRISQTSISATAGNFRHPVAEYHVHLCR